MVQKVMLMIYLGFLVAFCNCTHTFKAKPNTNNSDLKCSNVVSARKGDTNKPFRFHQANQNTTPEKVLCPAQLPIYCYTIYTFLCVEYDTAVFDGLNKTDDTQIVTFSANDVGIYSYYHEKELTCRLAQQTTDLTMEDFEIQRTILHQLSTKVRFELEAIKDDVIAICVVSIANSNQVEYFKYNDKSVRILSNI
jgi:hypothetical protein